MKTCPQCHKQYEDNLRFCLDDGAELADASQFQQPTVSFANDAQVVATEPAVIVRETADTVVRPGFQPPTGKRTSYLLPLVTGLFGIAILFLVGVVGVGWYFLRSRTGDVAAANTHTIEPPPVNTGQANASSNTSVDESNSNSPDTAFNTSVTGANSRPNTKLDAANDRATATPLPLKTPQLDKTLSNTGDRTLSPRPNVPKTISGGVLNGKAISLPKPPYPPAARAVHAGGAVSVQVLVDESGRVISANAVNGHPLLRPAAEVAARGARFSPTLLSGQPVKVSGIITYNFVP